MINNRTSKSKNNTSSSAAGPQQNPTIVPPPARRRSRARNATSSSASASNSNSNQFSLLNEDPDNLLFPMLQEQHQAQVARYQALTASSQEAPATNVRSLRERFERAEADSVAPAPLSTLLPATCPRQWRWFWRKHGATRSGLAF